MTQPSELYIIAEDIVETTVVTGEREATRDVGGGYGEPQQEVIKKLVRKRVPLDAKALKIQMDGLLSVVGDLFNHADQQTGMKLTEVELSVEINGEGQVSIIGMGGTIGNTGAITLKFTRP